MQKLKISEIIRLIEAEETFEVEAIDKSFSLKINRYVPFVCTAIHDGGALRSELKPKIALDDYERWYEEDPHTGSFIDSMPITLIGKDSRFEYDLNRGPDSCIYEEAWGKKVWKKPLSPKEKQTSLKKHQNFYKVVKALITKINERYGNCVVYDIHSYNYQRWDRPVPLFNIGCEKIDRSVFGEVIDHWQQELAQINLPGIENVSAINDVFYGRGYNLEFITENFPKVLVLATEIKKVYSNELTGEDYPKIIRDLQQKLKDAILSNAHFYNEKHSNWHSKTSSRLLDRKEDPAIFKVDKNLHQLLKNFELLAFVNPINTGTEFNKFVKSKFTEAPKFRYSPIKVNPFELKQQLGSLRTQEISDVSIRHLYEAVINSYFDKIDLLGSLKTRKFLYNSLRYFGRPSKTDLLNAEYILHLPVIPSEPKRPPILHIDKALEIFKEGLADYELNCKIELSNKVISQVMVLNSKRTILIRPDAKFTRREIRALIEHEIGVHMVTTMNSSQQSLKLFNLGLPVNTKTQEGLAILSEYLSGNMTLKRLQKLALRVVVTDMMCSGADFIDCFNYLQQERNLSSNDAYTLVTRIFRGGGFTKDYLYLSGFVSVFKLYNANYNLKPLMVGKTSLEFYDVIKEMLDREIIESPKYLTKSIFIDEQKEADPIYEYILSGLK